MRKITLTSLIITVFLGVGCTDSIILEEDTQIKTQRKSLEISERPVELTGDVKPFKYNGDEFIGIKMNQYYNNDDTSGGTYSIKEDGKVTENDIDTSLIIKSDFGNSVNYGIEGITQNIDKEKEGSIREFYYRDNLKDITIRLNGFNKLTKKYRTSSGYIFDAGKIVNTEDYYVFMASKYDSNYNNNYVGISPEEQQIVIIDIVNKKMYYKEESDIQQNIDPSQKDNLDYYNNYVSKLYYDNSLKSIMAINYDGKVKKVKFHGEHIKFEDYRTLNLQGYDINRKGGLYSGKISDENIIITLGNSDDKPFNYGVYNINTGEVGIVESDVYLTNCLEQHNLAIVGYKDETYLAQIKEDFSVEFLYKFSKKDYNCINAFGIMNDEGNKIFMTKSIYDGEKGEYGYDTSKVKYEYSIIDLISK